MRVAEVDVARSIGRYCGARLWFPKLELDFHLISCATEPRDTPTLAFLDTSSLQSLKHNRTNLKNNYII